jgi:hypothetical protein
MCEHNLGCLAIRLCTGRVINRRATALGARIFGGLRPRIRLERNRLALVDLLIQLRIGGAFVDFASHGAGVWLARTLVATVCLRGA